MTTQPFIDHISKRISLTPSEIEFIQSFIKITSFKKGEFLCEQGEVCTSSSYVIQGCLKTYHSDKDANDHVVSFAVEDWWCGDLASFITKSPADYSIQCLEDSEVIQLSLTDFDTLNAEVSLFERFFKELLQNAYVQSQKRIVNNFSLTAKERYMLFRSKHAQFEQRVPQYLIASYLGITKEFLSKIRKEIAYER